MDIWMVTAAGWSDSPLVQVMQIAHYVLLALGAAVVVALIAWRLIWREAQRQTRDHDARALCGCHWRWVGLEMRWARICAVVGAIVAGDLSWESISCAAAVGGSLVGWFVGVTNLRVYGDDDHYARLYANFARYGCVRGARALVDVSTGPGLTEKWCPTRAVEMLNAGRLVAVPVAGAPSAFVAVPVTVAEAPAGVAPNDGGFA